MTVEELIAALRECELPEAIVDVNIGIEDIRVIGIDRVLDVREGPNKGAWVTLELDGD